MKTKYNITATQSAGMGIAFRNWLDGYFLVRNQQLQLNIYENVLFFLIVPCEDV